MEHYAFLNKVFSLYSFVNLLQRDLCPSGTKFEAEVLAMVGKMLHGDEVSKVNRMDEQAGAITSGGTDSIFNAMLVYREWGRGEGHHRARGGRADDHPPRPPEGRALAGHEAHPPAGQCRFRGRRRGHARRRSRPTRSRCWPPPAPTRTAWSIRSEALSALALEHKIGLHVDGCLGGFILPWIEKLGYRRAAVGFPRARRHLDLLRHAQVRLFAQGHVHHQLPQQGPAPLHVLRTGRLARRRLCLPHRRGQPLRGPERSHVGGHGVHGRGGLPRGRHGASWIPPTRSAPASQRSPNCASWAATPPS